VTFSPYGEAIYGETFYGVPPSSNNLTTSFTITPIGYNGLQIDWTLPPGDWTSQILVRSSFGTPTNIYAEDGVTLLDETNPVSGYSSQFVDVGLASGYFYYYALFVFNTSGGLDQWQLAGSAQGLVITDYNFAQTYEGWIPDWYFNLDQNLTTSAQPEGPLERFVGLLGYETDWLRSEIESFFLFTNPQLISGALLPYLGANYGMSYEPELGMARYRVLVENAVALYKGRGTGNGIAAAASAFTGYGAVVTIGKNQEIQLDDSAFDRSTGHWEPTTNGTSITTVSASSQGVSPPHTAYVPVPGDLSVDSAYGANGYLPANNENVALIESVGAVYWTQQQFSTNWPSARSSFTLTYYPPQEGVLLFAGLSQLSATGSLDDTWLWNGTVWEQLLPAVSPGARYGYAMAYHPPTESIFLYGGYSITTGEYLDDMWSWNGTTWTQVTGASMPGPLYFASMVYEPDSESLVLFGGSGLEGTVNSVTYLWSGTAWSIGATAPNSPPGRQGAAMVYYPAADGSGSVLLFGGYSPTALFNDFWEWTDSTWSEITVLADVPSPRVGMSMVYDTNAAAVVLFGGGGPDDVVYDDTWTWGGVVWEEIVTTINPVPRAYYGLEWFPEDNVFILFGGIDGAYVYDTTFNDFWSGSLVDDPPISISTCNPLNATTLGLPVAQVAIPSSIVLSASFTPVNQEDPVLRFIQMQIDWYTQNGTPISSSVGAPIQEVVGEWIRPYAAGAPPSGAYYFGRTVNMTSYAPTYVPPPIPIPPPPPYQPPIVGISPTIVLGGFTAVDDVVGQSSFIASLGTNPNDAVLMDYLTVGTWAETFASYLTLTNFAAWGGPKLLKVPLQSTSNPTYWQDVISGSQDAEFTALFSWMYVNKVKYVCPGWYVNSTSYPWGVLTEGGAGANPLSGDTAANQAGYTEAWIHIWQLANDVQPGYFKWIWNQGALSSVNFTNLEPGGLYYPGDAYVDGIGLLITDTYLGTGTTFPGDAAMLTSLESGNSPNWDQTLSYAESHGKDIWVTDWGLSYGTPTGGDDPTFVSNVWALVLAAAESLATIGNKVYIFPNNDTFPEPFSTSPESLAELQSLVATAVTDGLLPIGLPVPTVTELSPATGLTTGGASVIITGTNFAGVTGVDFGGVSVPFTIVSDTELTAIAPAGTVGTEHVTVITPAGTSVTAAGNVYTYTAPVVAPAMEIAISIGYDPALFEASDSGLSQYEVIEKDGFWGVRLDAPYVASGISNQEGIQTALNAGLNVMPILDGYNAATTTASEFASFCGTQVAYWASLGIHHWEVLNEPNLSANWNPSANTVNPAAYAVLLRAAYEAIKAADSTALVSSGGVTTDSTADGTSLGGGNYSGQVLPNSFVYLMYEAMGGSSVGYCDAIGMHPYTEAAPSIGNGSNWGYFFNPSGTDPYAESSVCGWNSILAVMGDNGESTKPIWITEVGYETSVVTDAEQTSYISTMLTMAQAIPNVAFFFVFNWNDDADGDWGLNNSLYEAKSSLAAVETFLTPSTTTPPPAAPTITSLSPTSATTAGGTTVTVIGTGFTGATALHFGSHAATSFEVVSSTEITAITPAESAASIEVTVTTSNGTSAGKSFVFTAPSSGGTPSGPTGSWTVAWEDLFNDAAGMSGPTNGLSNKKWNKGWALGPTTIGGLGNQTTNIKAANGANGNFQGVNTVSLQSDGCHLDCIASPYTLPDAEPAGAQGPVDCGGISTAGILVLNPKGVTYGTAIQNAINEGTITSIDSACVVQFVAKYPGPGYTTYPTLTNPNIPLWWPAMWMTNASNYNPTGASSNWPGEAATWQEETDVWESYSDGNSGTGLIGNQINYGNPTGPLGNDGVIPSIPSTYATTDLGAAFHTYTFEISANAATIDVWVDGIHCGATGYGGMEGFPDSVGFVGLFDNPQYLMWTMQTHADGTAGVAGPPVTTNEGEYHGWIIQSVQVFVPA
jgi:phage tail-like protein